MQECFAFCFGTSLSQKLEMMVAKAEADERDQV
ncbi:DUF1382 family protein [Escherichia coli]|nr:DUF1382 family protein [Escherichia coli]EHY3369456.1 DUF1382 family protein [Escherichia coli]EJR7563477.1 DUF1382 family protein [Escherichia coli]MBA0958290.1 DUF1382 family protein [Escherichia coli]MBA0987689.1 DUF1382 family protein [Escherichia coli]